MLYGRRVNFGIYKDLDRVNANSLLIDSGEEVAFLQVGNIYLSLMCYGEVRVNYKEDTFRCASDYPQIVTDYFLDKIEDKQLLERLDDEIWVGDNNWFQDEIFIVKDEKTGELESIEEINGYADTFDIEGSLKNDEVSMSVMLYNILLSRLKELKNMYENEIEELKNLDLSNI